METRPRISTVFILVLCYVFALSVASFGGLSSYDQEAVRLGGRLCFLIFLFLLGYVRREAFRFSKPLFLPLYLIAFSNSLILLLEKRSIIAFSSYDALRLANMFLGVFVEEKLFRSLMLSGAINEKEKKKWLFASSLCFGLMHLANGFSLACLIQVAYTAGLGFILGLLYVYGGGFWPCYVLHALFNLMNNEVYRWFGGGNDSFLFYLINVLWAVIFACYALFLYFHCGKKPSKI